MLNLIILMGFVVMGAAIYFLHRRQAKLNLQIQENEREREVVFSFLNKIGQSITSELEVEKALQFTCEFIVEETGAESGAIFVIDPKDGALAPRVVVGLFPPLHEIPENAIARKKFLHDRLMKERFPVGEGGGLVGLVAKSGEPLLINAALTDSRVPQTCPEIMKIRQFMAVPMMTRDRVLGVIAVVNKKEGTGFNEMDATILDTLSDQASVTLNILQLYTEQAEKQRLEQELAVAKNFQQMLLPKTFPEVAELDLFGLSQPALEVGGDYFDIFKLDERTIGVVIADVSGKGIPGALVMASVRSNLRAESRRLRQPREVLRKVNTDMLADTKDSVFITMTYAVIDLDTMKLCFARAGHEPLISSLDGSGQLAFHTPDGVAVGMTDDTIFQITREMELALQPGQTIVLYTDGVTEAMNAKGEEFGMDRFTNIIKSHHEMGPKELCGSIMKNIIEFRGAAAQYDDITMIAIRARAEAFAGRQAPGKVLEMG